MSRVGSRQLGPVCSRVPPEAALYQRTAFPLLPVVAVNVRVPVPQRL